MAVVKVKMKEKPYVQILKSTLEDGRLSWQATCILTYLLGKHDNWEINLHQLAKVKTNGMHSTREALLELRRHEYCHLFSITKNGKKVDTAYVVFEEPTSIEVAIDSHILVEEGHMIHYMKPSEKMSKIEKGRRVATEEEKELEEKITKQISLKEKAENLYYEGKNFKEISEFLSVSHGTVRIWSFRGHWKEKKESVTKKCYSVTKECYSVTKKCDSVTERIATKKAINITKKGDSLTQESVTSVTKESCEVAKSVTKECYSVTMQLEQTPIKCEVLPESDFPNAENPNAENHILNNNIYTNIEFNNNKTTTKKEIEKPSSRIFDFLDLDEFEKINNITKKNIRKNIKDLSIEKLREVYKKAELVISSGRATSFDAVLYKGLNEEWNFVTIEEKGVNNNANIPVILDEEKENWIKTFSGLKSDPVLYDYIKKLVSKIPIDILKSNKSKMRSMTTFEFKNHLKSMSLKCNDYKNAFK